LPIIKPIKVDEAIQRVTEPILQPTPIIEAISVQNLNHLLCLDPIQLHELLIKEGKMNNIIPLGFDTIYTGTVIFLYRNDLEYAIIRYHPERQQSCLIGNGNIPMSMDDYKHHANQILEWSN
jgi:hypothetical protein